MTDKTDKLRQLLFLSSAMLEKAKQASWKEVAVLQEERCELIDELFLEPVPTSRTEDFWGGVSGILAIDREIIALAIPQKLELAQLLQKLDQGKKALKAYGS